MELHAGQRMLTMAESHYRAVLRPRRDLEVGRQIVALHHQGVIAGCHERAWDTSKDGLLAVKHARHLSMHHLRGAPHLAAVRFAQTLVTQANAESRQRRVQLEQEILADTCIGRCSRPGREHGGDRSQLPDVGERDLVVSTDDDLLAQLTEVLNKVVGERVVVVDHQHYVLAVHVSPLPDRPPEKDPRIPGTAPAAARTLYCGSRGTLPPGPSRQRCRPPPGPLPVHPSPPWFESRWRCRDPR